MTGNTRDRMTKQMCIVIPLASRKHCKYAAEKLKDYTVLTKLIKEVDVDGTEEKIDYLYM